VAKVQETSGLEFPHFRLRIKKAVERKRGLEEMVSEKLGLETWP
jgi:hypothetical protein